MKSGFFLFLSGGLLFFGLQCQSPFESKQQAVPRNPDQARLLFLGDSYTIGQSVDVADRWPSQLIDRLYSEGYAIENSRIIARTGWTTQDLERALQETSPGGPFAMVSLLIGVNDQFQGRGITLFQQGFDRLLNNAILYAGHNPSRVVVLSIPDYSVTPFGRTLDSLRIASELDRFNAYMRSQTEQKLVHLVDITGISRRAAFDKSLLAFDQLHPSAKMYTFWVNEILPIAQNILADYLQNRPGDDYQRASSQK